MPFLAWLGNNDYDAIIMQQPGSLIPEQREMLLGYQPGTPISAMKEPYNGQQDYDLLFWIDSDILFQPEDFQKLVEADKPIISGAYAKDMKGNLAVALMHDGWKNHEKDSLISLTWKDLEGKTEPFIVVSSAMGFCLIQKGVFEKIKRPWFACSTVDLYRNGDKYLIGEDVYFSLNASYHGFVSWVHPLVKVAHLKQSAWTCAK